ALEAALAAAVDGSGTREMAQAAWRQAMMAWERVELMQVGPAGSSLDVMGGQSLRAFIYTWPTLNLCLVDQLTVGDDYADPDALDAIAGTPRGLGAIEYLLFNESPANNCTEVNQINSEGTWNALSSEIPARRLAYAAALAELVGRSAQQLVASWDPAGDGFIEEFTDPGRSGAVYGSAQEGLNAMSDAMFYLDKETKDMKLAQPVGITGCDTPPCLDLLESRWAFQTTENIASNLTAFQSLFLGGAAGTDALGYDDLLVEMGAPDVAADMEQAIAAAIVATQAIPGALGDAVVDDPDAVFAAHAAVRAVTDVLKADFLSVLDLEAPARAAGDND
ncbi:MAG: imelysin family protein, partial [Myxococcota bacterium]